MARNTLKPSDVVTLADLAPRHRVVGGAQRHVFGADPSGQRGGTMANAELEGRMSGKKAKDPAPKSSKPVKGGRIALNDNLTLVRAAKPAKKDLPAGKDIKAGKKAR